MAAHEAARGRNAQCKRKIGDILGKDLRRVADDDATGMRGLDIDAVETGAVAGDDLQRRQAVEHGRIDMGVPDGDAANTRSVLGKKRPDRRGIPRQPDGIEGFLQFQIGLFRQFGGLKDGDVTEHRHA